MEARSVGEIVRALNQANVRYLVVGGLAVVAHGHLRFTADVDLVLDLAVDNVRRAVEALSSLGYRPRAPVAFIEYADPTKRATWIREKGLTVFSAFSPAHAATEVDLFVENPFDFEQAFSRSERMEVAPETWATIVGLKDLIELKRHAGRPLDREDIEALQLLQRPAEESS